MDALIFDFDGTIIETEGPDCQTWQEIFAAHGCELPLTTWVGYIGTAAGTFTVINGYTYIITGTQTVLWTGTDTHIVT